MRPRGGRWSGGRFRGRLTKPSRAKSDTVPDVALSLDPPMILKAGSRSPRSDPVIPSRRLHLPGAAVNSANQGADLLKHR